MVRTVRTNAEKIRAMREVEGRTEVNSPIRTLKPCPFCGGKAVVHVNDGVRVVCTECKATTNCLIDSYSQGRPTGSAVDSVIEAWNRRTANE